MAQIIDFRQEKLSRALLSLFKKKDEEKRLFWCLDEGRAVPYSYYDRLLTYFLDCNMLPKEITLKTSLDIQYYILDRVYEVLVAKKEYYHG